MLHEFIIGHLPQLGEVPLTFAEVGVGCFRVQIYLSFCQDVTSPDESSGLIAAFCIRTRSYQSVCAGQKRALAYLGIFFPAPLQATDIVPEPLIDL